MINGQTRLIGLLGDPVNHSLSPAMHNAALKKLELNWCYLALPCKEENLRSVLDGLLKVNCIGLNITIPHKKNVAQLCNKLTPIAKEIGAVNTIFRNKEKGWTGTNTDIEGFLYPLEMAKDIKRNHAIILGCGGSARAVITGLQKLRYKKIIIISRREKSLKIFLENIILENKSKKFKTKIIGILESDPNLIDHIKEANLIINTTPNGMQKDNEKSNQNIPLSEPIWRNLNHQTTLYDLIYTPRPTAWLKLGKNAGCKTIDGLEMLIQQGAASLRLWSGINTIPIDIMRKAAEYELNI